MADDFRTLQVQANGVSGVDGDYLLPALSPSLISAVARRVALTARERAELRSVRARQSDLFLGLASADPTDMGQAGWGVIFGTGASSEVRAALEPLLNHRRHQASIEGQRYREFYVGNGYRPGSTAADFLIDNGVPPGQPARPDRVPYYLLIVADPREISFNFQYALDVTYGVGRLWFEDVGAYRRYVESVLTSEQESRRRRIAFFGTRNPDDAATRQSADQLVRPLAEWTAARRPSDSVNALIGDSATKDQLGRLFGDSAGIDLVFAACHGMGYPFGHPSQRTRQGALVCQEWPGPIHWRQAVPVDFYFAAEDVHGDVGPTGEIIYLFACYAVATPQLDDFSVQTRGSRRRIAPEPFVARLPQILLGHARGGALAVIGHVDRAWGHSFSWPGVAGTQIDTYTRMIGRLLTGSPVGWAAEALSDRYATLATQLDEVNTEVDYGRIPDELLLSILWTARNDARNVIVFGDPAVRMRNEVDEPQPVAST